MTVKTTRPTTVARRDGRRHWEMRGEPRHHLSSRCCVGWRLTRALALAPRLGMHAEVDLWTAERDESREAVLTRGWSEAPPAYAQ